MRLIDIRNNALLQLGFFGAFRRSELVSIQWEHIRFVPEGIEILIPRSKTDQSGEGQVCAIPYGNELLCPVKALKDWQDYSGLETSFIFRKLTKSERLQIDAIKPNQVNQIIKDVARACKLPDAESYSNYSLRRGFATEASKKGAPFGAVMGSVAKKFSLLTSGKLLRNFVCLWLVGGDSASICTLKPALSGNVF